MSPPKVNIIIPVYNSEKYLKRCFDSLVNQTYQNWEAIVVDDASTDNSCQKVIELTENDPRFKFTRLEKNCGVSKVRNLALSMITGKYTAFLDSDDYWEQDMLEVLVSKAEESDFDVVQCRFMYDYPGGKQVLPKGAFDKYTELDKSSMGKVYYRMATGINMNHVCMKLVKSEIIKDLQFDPQLKTAEDLKFCVKMFSRVSKYCFVDKAMYHYCRNEDSLTGKGLGAKEKLKANRAVSKVMVQELPVWGKDTFYWRTLCTMRPYIITVSKVIRTATEKLFSKKADFDWSVGNVKKRKSP